MGYMGIMAPATSVGYETKQSTFTHTEGITQSQSLSSAPVRLVQSIP